MQDIQGSETSLCESEKVKKVRGRNKCKNVAKLKPEEKLSVEFYHNRVTGENHAAFSRHLGMLVRDGNMCPVRVHSWAEIKQHKLDHMWEAVTEASARNSLNRSKLRMPHRTGSKPFRQIIYDMGGKDGKPPNMEIIFFETHKKGDKLIEPETNKKYAEIKELVQSEPSLTNIEVVERCFGPQSKSHTVGFGGGITAKELRCGNSSKAALLNELREAQKENESTRKENESLKKRLEWIESLLFSQPSSPTSSSERNRLIKLTDEEGLEYEELLREESAEIVEVIFFILIWFSFVLRLNFSY